MKAFKIGRSRKNDVVLPHESVSRAHAELVATENGRYYMTDCDSTLGTFRQKGERWVRIRQEFVDPDEPLMLGEYRTSARGLARALPDEKRNFFIPSRELQIIEGIFVGKTSNQAMPTGPVERDPETGEVVPTHAIRSTDGG